VFIPNVLWESSSYSKAYPASLGHRAEEYSPEMAPARGEEPRVRNFRMLPPRPVAVGKARLNPQMKRSLATGADRWQYSGFALGPRDSTPSGCHHGARSPRRKMQNFSDPRLRRCHDPRPYCEYNPQSYSLTISSNTTSRFLLKTDAEYSSSTFLRPT
jgi:hypothetical protein